MKKENDIKNNDSCAKQAYVPASVKVIEITSRRVLCGSETETVDNFDHIQ